MRFAGLLIALAVAAAAEAPVARITVNPGRTPPREGVVEFDLPGDACSP